MSVTWRRGRGTDRGLQETGSVPEKSSHPPHSHFPLSLKPPPDSGWAFPHLIAFQRGSHQHHRPHGGHHIVWGNMFCLQNGQEVKTKILVLVPTLCLIALGAESRVLVPPLCSV